MPSWSLVWEGSSPAKPKEMTFSHLTVGPPPAGGTSGSGVLQVAWQVIARNFDALTPGSTSITTANKISSECVGGLLVVPGLLVHRELSKNLLYQCICY